MEKSTGVIFEKVYKADRAGSFDLYIGADGNSYKLRRSSLSDPTLVLGASYEISWNPNSYKGRDYRMIEKWSVDDPFADDNAGAAPTTMALARPQQVTGPVMQTVSRDHSIHVQVALKTAFDFYGREIECASMIKEAFALADEMLVWITKRVSEGPGTDKVN